MAILDIHVYFTGKKAVYYKNIAEVFWEVFRAEQENIPKVAGNLIGGHQN
jgi:hypothetical protein